MLGILMPSFLLYVFGTFNLIGIRMSFLPNQIIFLILGIIAFLFIRKIGIHFFRLNARTFYWVFILLLIVTFVIGLEVKGSRRWISLYVFNFQSSEFFKIFFILFFADFFVRGKRYIKNVSFYLLSIFYFIIPFFIIFKQPDLGSSLVYLFIFIVMLLFSGVPKKYLLYTAIIISVCLPLGLPLLKDYQKQRITSFLSPHIDQRGTSYNMRQAIITIGSGNFIGRGLGFGTQSQLFFLPENHTDFAFSSLVEQFGFIGGFVLILLYLFITFNLIKKIIQYYYGSGEESSFNFLFTVGFLAFFIFQVFVNMGMNLGVLPVAGITLPLISYGGSSLITWMIGVGMLPGRSNHKL